MEGFLGKFLMTLLVAMVPVVELRGAIPIGVASGQPLGPTVLAAIVGNLLPVPFIILYVEKIFAWLRGRSARLDDFVSGLEARAARKSEVVQRYAFWGLAFFVGIPLPGTGAWTGALIAAVMNMPMKRALPSIAIGVLAAGLIVSTLTYGVGALFAA